MDGRLRVGIDIGNVIINGSTEFFSSEFLNAPAVEGAFDSVKALVVGEVEVFFISKAFPRNQMRTREWLRAKGFWEYVGLDEDRLFFVTHRASKVAVAHDLDLDVMVDDRKDICSAMEEAGIRPILFTSWDNFWRQI